MVKGELWAGCLPQLCVTRPSDCSFISIWTGATGWWWLLLQLTGRCKGAQGTLLQAKPGTLT